MNRKLILLIITTMVTTTLYAQYNYHHPEIFYLLKPAPHIYQDSRTNDNISDNPGLRFRMDAGIQFNSINGYNSAISWLSPKALLPVNQRLMVEAGGIFYSAFIPNVPGEESQVNNFIAFARGIYSVNQDLTIYGEIARSLASPLNSAVNFESVTLGMEYYVTPGFSIGASFSSQKGVYDPFYLNQPYPVGVPGSSPFLFY